MERARWMRQGRVTTAPRRGGRARRASVALGCAAALIATTAGSAQAASSSYKLYTAKLGDGRTVVLRWNPCQTITYKVNVASLPSSKRDAMLRELKSGMAKLASASGMTFSYKGTTTMIPDGAKTASRQPAEIVLAVASPRQTDLRIGGTTLGIGGFSYWTWRPAGSSRYSAAIARGYAVFDVTAMGRLTPGFGSGVRRGNVVLHELGHVVGLDHVPDRAQEMYPSITSGNPGHYASGDRAGLVRVGRPAGCLSVPSWVVSSSV